MIIQQTVIKCYYSLEYKLPNLKVNADLIKEASLIKGSFLLLRIKVTNLYMLDFVQKKSLIYFLRNCIYFGQIRTKWYSSSTSSMLQSLHIRSFLGILLLAYLPVCTFSE